MINPLLLTFLKGIKAHNEKEWYEAHKPAYKLLRAEFTKWLESLAVEISHFDPAVAAGIKKGNETLKVFRIHRDARFSKDKATYKTNLSGYISADISSETEPVYYVSIEPGGHSTLGGGIYMPERRYLGIIRDTIHEKPTALKKIESDPVLKKAFPNLLSRDHSLKTAPRGFDVSDPAIEYLRLQSFAVHKTLSDTELQSKNLNQKLVHDFAALLPLTRFLRTIKR